MDQVLITAETSGSKLADANETANKHLLPLFLHAHSTDISRTLVLLWHTSRLLLIT